MYKGVMEVYQRHGAGVFTPLPHDLERLDGYTHQAREGQACCMSAADMG